MRKCSWLRTLAFAAVLSVPLAQAALADQPDPQTMCQNSSPTPGFLFNGPGPYDAPLPPVGA